MDNVKLMATIHSDEDGYFDRECPFDECKFQFKVFVEDWEAIFRDEEVFCPRCGHKSEAKNFFTQEQVEQVQDLAKSFAEGLVYDYFQKSFEDINRKSRQSNNLIKISFNIKGSRPIFIDKPINSMDVFEQKIVCTKCNARYALIGSGYFCPCCGNQSIETIFDNSIKKIEAKLNYLDNVQIEIAKSNKDDAEIIKRSILESALEDCIISFQFICHNYYKQFKNSKNNVIPNDFQNIEKGNKLWKELLNVNYDDWIGTNQLVEMNILFQKRHLLTHYDGMVDSKYLFKTNDFEYQLGQRIVLHDYQIFNLLDIIKLIVNRITDNLTND